MAKFIVNVTRYLRYSVEIEAEHQKDAEAEAKSAIEQGILTAIDDEMDFDVIDIEEEEDAEAK